MSSGIQRSFRPVPEGGLKRGFGASRRRASSASLWFSALLVLAVVLCLPSAGEARRSVRIDKTHKRHVVSAPLRVVAVPRGQPRKVSFAIDRRRLFVSYQAPHRLGGPAGQLDPATLPRGRHRLIVRAYYGPGLRHRAVTTTIIRVRKHRISGLLIAKATTKLPKADAASAPASAPAPAQAPVATAAAAGTPGWKLVKEWTFDGSSLSGLNVHDGVRTSGNTVGGLYKRANVRAGNGEMAIVGDGINGGGVNLNDPATYGRWEVRARMDAGAGAAPGLVLWPTSDRWPVDGELDLMESPYGDHQTVQQTTHWGQDNQQENVETRIDAKQWHSYAVEWEQGVVRYFIDDKLTRERKGTPGYDIPNKPMSLAIQVDGPNGWIPTRDGSSPAEMAFHVDWVRRLVR